MLKRIQREFGGRIALDCWVIRGGRIRVGDPVELAGRDARPADEMWGRYASEEAQRK